MCCYAVMEDFFNNKFIEKLFEKKKFFNTLIYLGKRKKKRKWFETLVWDGAGDNGENVENCLAVDWSAYSDPSRSGCCRPLCSPCLLKFMRTQPALHFSSLID